MKIYFTNNFLDSLFSRMCAGFGSGINIDTQSIFINFITPNSLISLFTSIKYTVKANFFSCGIGTKLILG